MHAEKLDAVDDHSSHNFLNTNICHLHFHWMSIAFRLKPNIFIKTIKHHDEIPRPIARGIHFTSNYLLRHRSCNNNGEIWCVRAFKCMRLCVLTFLVVGKNIHSSCDISKYISHVNNQFSSAVFSALTSLRLSLYYIAVLLTLNVPFTTHKMTWITSIKENHSRRFFFFSPNHSNPY